MSASLRCVCGKDNLVNAADPSAGFACLRCGRPLETAKVLAVVSDNRGRLVPVEPEAERAKDHPAAALEPPTQNQGPREYLYWALSLALLPLAFSLGQPPDDTEVRFRKTLNESPPSVRQRIEKLERDPFATLEDLFDILPGNRIVGAFAPRFTQIHWAFAGLSVALFLAVAASMFPDGGAKPFTLIAVGFFTATVGIMILLMVQPFFTFTVNDVLDDTKHFTISLFGYILGVGLFEELAKLLPVVWRIRRGPLRWRAACLWGLASGAGFGVAEGIFYSERLYNGVAELDSYFVRFLSCVALHAIWTASASLSLVAYSRSVVGPQDKGVLAFALLRAVAIPAVLHGVYDVVLQYHYDVAALVAALVSFGWLACQIESTRVDCTVAPALESAAEPAELAMAAK